MQLPEETYEHNWKGTPVKETDHLTTDGKLDFQAYFEAQRKNGELCEKCHGIAVICGVGQPTLCSSCQRSEQPEPFIHHIRVRCPKCRHVFNCLQVCDTVDPYMHVLEVLCPECAYKFCLGIKVYFISPKLDVDGSAQNS